MSHCEASCCVIANVGPMQQKVISAMIFACQNGMQQQRIEPDYNGMQVIRLTNLISVIKLMTWPFLA